jgi:hypothetical protein
MRGELQLMENIMAFFIIIILGMIAFIYFATAQAGADRERIAEREDLRALQTARSLYNLPELSCTWSQTGRCIDLDKAEIFGSMLTDANATIYFPVFGRSRIAIDCLGCDETIIYDQLDATTFRQLHVPVLVYNATSDSRLFGWVEVRV